MLSRTVTGLIVVAALLSLGGVLPAQDAADEQRIDRLLRGLTAAHFDVRRDSETRLRALGADALPILREVVSTEELEVRHRVERIIADVERRAVSEALDQLEQGEKPRNLELVYAWERFRDQFGNDHASRQLYAQMLRAEPTLMRAADGPAEDLEMEFERRCADLALRRGGSRQATPPLATVAALLFVGGQPECRPSAMAANCVNTIVQQGEFRSTLNQSDPPEHLRSLLGRWIGRAESATAMQRLSLAASFDLREGLDVAEEMIRTRAFGAQIQYAILYVAKVGGLQELPVLEELLEDETAINTGRRGRDSNFTSRLQDVALIGLLNLTGQDWRDYGFEEPRPHQTYLYAPGSVGFEEEASREAALQQWREWAAANLRELHAAPEWAIEGVTT